MKTKKLLLLFVFAVIAMSIHAQVKIGDNPATIQSGSVLELESLTKGLRLPRVPLNDVTKWTLDGSAVSGMMICNESGSVKKGIYYWNTDSVKWLQVVNKSELANLVSTYITQNKTVMDSIVKVVNNTITKGTIDGKNLTSVSHALKVINGTGASLKDVQIQLDSVALGHLLNTSPVADSLAVAVAKNTIMKDSVTSLIENAVTADNGLNATKGKVELGGALTKATTLTTTGTNTLAIAGLQSGTKSDSIVTVDPTSGVLHRISVSNVSSVQPLSVKTADYTVTLTDNTIVLSKNATVNVTFTLPPSPENGRMFRFVNLSSANTITFNQAIRTMSGATTSTLGIGTTYVNGNILGNKMAIQWDALDSEWIQVGN
ncbi:MAG: hypothetical protein P4L28_07245 [Paludibacteraceae bacterium]|nr:hypothetical protein [Paludibacteraceae bacterium]